MTRHPDRLANGRSEKLPEVTRYLVRHLRRSDYVERENAVENVVTSK